MDYSKQSDFGINNLVAIALGAKVTESYEVGDSRAAVYYELDEEEFCVRRGYGDINCQFDPCNSPTDAWPIIVGHKPSLINADNEWLCVPENTAVDGITGDGVQMIYSGAGAVHANPPRAAMVMFLTIQDESNADV